MRAKRLMITMVMSLFLSCLLGACSSQESSDNISISTSQDDPIGETQQLEETDENPENSAAHSVPAELKTIPEEYYQAAAQ